jgi:uncharacterized protein YkuJ
MKNEFEKNGTNLAQILFFGNQAFFKDNIFTFMWNKLTELFQSFPSS